MEESGSRETIPLSFWDASFLMMEGPTSPMHGCGIQVYRVTEGDAKDTTDALYERWRGYPVSASPCNQALLPAGWLKSTFSPAWVTLKPEEIDLDYHFKRWALPSGGSDIQLNDFCSRLASQQLDMTRPLWELHLIDGVDDNSFAICLKMHHALFDGLRGMRWTVSTWNPDPSVRDTAPPWTTEIRGESVEEPRSLRITGAVRKMMGIYGRFGERIMDWGPVAAHLNRTERVAGLLGAVGGQVAGVPKIAATMRETVKTSRDKESGLAAPYTAPKTFLAEPLTKQRKIASYTADFDRIRAIGKQVGGTLNDTVLGIAGGVMRRYVAHLDKLPEESLVALCAVGLNKDSDKTAGNSIASITVRLGTHIEDPIKRLEYIMAGASKAKDLLSGLPRKSLTTYGVLANLPAMLDAFSKEKRFASRTSNIMVSNIPGPRGTFYLDGAPLVRFSCVGMLQQGTAIMLVVYSRGDKLEFCYVTCPDVAPDTELLGQYTEDAIVELEQALSAAPAKSPQQSPAPSAKAGRSATKAEAAAPAAAKGANGAKSSASRPPAKRRKQSLPS